MQLGRVAEEWSISILATSTRSLVKEQVLHDELAMVLEFPGTGVHVSLLRTKRSAAHLQTTISNFHLQPTIIVSFVWK